MPLKPIRNRLLVRPDPAATHTEGGLIIPDNAKDHVAMSGEVVAMGPECKGPAYRVRAACLADVEHAIDRVAERVTSLDWPEELRTELRVLLAGYYDDAQAVQVGAQVCFPYTAGTDISDGAEALILVREEDLAATWHEDEVDVAVRDVA